MHRKEEYYYFKEAIEEEELHQRDRCTFMSQQHIKDGILISILQEVEGTIKWQKEWVQEHILM